jgi:hypothetical protein
MNHSPALIVNQAALVATAFESVRRDAEKIGEETRKSMDALITSANLARQCLLQCFQDATFSVAHTGVIQHFERIN